MILILSEKNDHSTNDVMDWVMHYGAAPVRLNDVIDAGDISISQHDIVLKCGGRSISINEISAFWYRRGGNVTTKMFAADGTAVGKEVRYCSEREKESLSKFLHSRLKSIPNHLGDYYAARINKMQVLDTAAALGLLIPDYLVTTKKTDVEVFRKTAGAIICKPLERPVQYSDDTTWITAYTELVDDAVLEKIPDTFFPSLFQQYIEKFVELRVVCLRDKCYGMAIFSQADEKTKIDFRKYNYSKPNRYVPYRLPEDIQAKLLQVMHAMDLESGSADIIVEKDTGKYYFLEINPVGQFGMTSYPCNYYIEKEIATQLVKQ
jgi:ATP-GRASP peptide maturase of grasp-with-spasm system